MEDKTENDGQYENGSGSNREPHRPPPLPIEMWTEIGTHLVSADPVSTASDLTSLRHINHTTHNAVECSSLSPFRKRIIRLGTIARKLHDAAIPAAGLEASADYPEPDPEGRFAEPEMRITAAVPTLNLQGIERQSAMVGAILALDEDEQGASLYSLASGFDHLKARDQQRLVERSLYHLDKPGDEMSLSRDGACNILAYAHDRLNPQQKARILDIVHDRPSIRERYYAAVDSRQQARTSVATSPTSLIGHSNGPAIDEKLSTLETALEEMTASTDLSPREQMGRIKNLGQSVAETLSQARGELITSTRSRNPSGIDR